MGYGLLLDTKKAMIATSLNLELLTPGVLGHNDNVNYSTFRVVVLDEEAICMTVLHGWRDWYFV